MKGESLNHNKARTPPSTSKLHIWNLIITKNKVYI